MHRRSLINALLSGVAVASFATSIGALAAGMQPTKDAIALEDIHSPYANIIAVRAQDKDQPWVKELVAPISRRTCGGS